MISSGNYALDAATFPGWLLPAYGYEWPETRDQANAVTIRYETGYADAAALPGDMRAWLLLTAAFIYAQREVMVLGGKVAEIPARFADSLLDLVPSFQGLTMLAAGDLRERITIQQRAEAL